MKENIRQQLEQLAEEEYRIFASGLIPDTNNMLGVRLPNLRKIAKQIAKEDWKEYLLVGGENSFEEIMLKGMVIGYVKCPLEERFLQIETFIPKIDNWSVCDSFCSGLKFVRENKQKTLEFLSPYLHSKQEFEVRFAVVMLIFYYIDIEYIDQVLEILDGVEHSGYYVKMAVAWAISICYIQFPEETMEYLKKNHLDDFTYNKALQKIIESKKVNKETKKKMREMKR